jgi:hypothetical protein
MESNTELVEELVWSDVTGDLAGLDSECENVGLVTPDPGGREMLTWVATQGLWRGPGDGEWNPTSDPQRSPPRSRVRSIIVDPANSERMWMSGTAQDPGVYLSEDGGRTFTILGVSRPVGSLSVDLSDPDRSTLVVVTEEDNGLSRSFDGGATWEDVSSGLPYNRGRMVAPLVLEDGTYLVGSSDGPLSGIFRSDDAGGTWERVHSGGVAGEPVRRADGSIAWLGEYGSGLIVSDDLGRSWNENDGGGVAWTARDLVELPDGRLATSGLDRLLITADDGATWRPWGPQLPFVPSGITFSATGQHFYVWEQACGYETSYPIQPEAIMRVDFA